MIGAAAWVAASIETSYDTLSGLLTRAALEQRIKLMFSDPDARSRRWSLLYVDIDRRQVRGGRIAREAKALVSSACYWAKGHEGPSEILYQTIIHRAVRWPERLLRWSRRYPAAAALIVTLFVGLAATTGFWLRLQAALDSERCISPKP